MARDIGILIIMFRGTWVNLNCIMLYRHGNLISIKYMPVIYIQVSLYLDSLPIIDGARTIKLNADKIIKVVRNR